MHFPFLDNWRKPHPDAEGAATVTDELSGDQTSAAQLLSECELLREQAGAAGVELDDTVESLTALDQLLPHWREDPEVTPWLGADAGLYLGTVMVRSVPGARWVRWPDGQPVVRLPSGREVDVLAEGATWAETGSPELSQAYAEVSED
ncbi:DUF6278 family protein [Streptomyces tubbatahanensis]|uniref:DUF6278 family protein n=1 Tax=Streptomyces tubbatahanensis TaxID=2923272 RepID=A0ABY3XYZ2_9ACTN|nr:DUF6278 family protein [Streptomyces tubbatahanensis]UNS99712.1 DUF6278 family protein [Streptomyces tubbatahanensis]